MENDPSWEKQTWNVPYEDQTQIVRIGRKWFVMIANLGLIVPIRAKKAESAVEALVRYYERVGRESLEERRKAREQKRQ